MHISLRPKTNIRLIAVWIIIGAFIGWYFSRPWLWVMFVAGAALGVVAGYLQLRALQETASELVAAESMLAIRNALRQSSWGQAYLSALWGGVIALGFLSRYLFGLEMEMGIGWLAGYIALARVRDIMTLPATYMLEKLDIERQESSARDI